MEDSALLPVGFRIGGDGRKVRFVGHAAEAAAPVPILSGKKTEKNCCAGHTRPYYDWKKLDCFHAFLSYRKVLGKSTNDQKYIERRKTL